jgi:hypothetical protein
LRDGAHLRDTLLLLLLNGLLLLLLRERCAQRSIGRPRCGKQRLDRIEGRHHRRPCAGRRGLRPLVVKVNLEILLSVFRRDDAIDGRPQEIDHDSGRGHHAGCRDVHNRDGPTADKDICRCLRAHVRKVEDHARGSVAVRRDGLGRELAVSGERDAGARRFSIAADRFQHRGEASWLDGRGYRRRRAIARGAQREGGVEIDMNEIAIAAHLMRGRLSQSDAHARDA